ncbi:unnamed protein product [Prorocentrum cordatum]|uniref:Uncharacterized protein n=1 Tax=Prorocentrum cordatum TaxID=2364126 RepID=A0ABN9RJ74_9DINO|nr:unnamed protein product [Polarella glacialis]
MASLVARRKRRDPHARSVTLPPGPKAALAPTQRARGLFCLIVKLEGGFPHEEESDRLQRVVSSLQDEEVKTEAKTETNANAGAKAKAKAKATTIEAEEVQKSTGKPDQAEEAAEPNAAEGTKDEEVKTDAKTETNANARAKAKAKAKATTIEAEEVQKSTDKPDQAEEAAEPNAAEGTKDASEPSSSEAGSGLAALLLGPAALPKGEQQESEAEGMTLDADADIDEEALAKDGQKGEMRLQVMQDSARSRRELMAMRRRVYLGKLEKTSGGLTRDDLIMNKRGQVVSKKRNKAGLEAYKKYLKAWVDAVQAARASLNVTGFQAVGGQTEAGQRLLEKARAVYAEISKLGEKKTLSLVSQGGWGAGKGKAFQLQLQLFSARKV